MECIRTPDDRFSALPDFAFTPRYCDIPSGDGTTLRMHYLDEGPRDGDILVCLHGEPTWSYLYRKMIPPLTAAGYRTLVPDAIGFGRSDKPVAREAYTYAGHVAWLAAFFDALAIERAVLVAQDWGGLLGLRLVAQRPQRFTALVLSNTFLPTGDEAPGDAFVRWRDASQRLPEPFPAGSVLGRTCTPPLSADVAAGYDAPFPEERYAAGARAFPLLVPTHPNDPASAANRAAWRVLERFAQPVLCAFSDGDPITRGCGDVFRARIPGARGVTPVTIRGASHFVQEDRPHEFAAAIIDFLARVTLVEVEDRDFAWLLGGVTTHPELRLAPGGVAEPAVLEHIRTLTQRVRAAQQTGSWMIVHAGEVVGMCGYHDAPSAAGDVEIGYGIAESRRRRGFMTAALRAVVALAEGDPAVRTLHADTLLANTASHGVLVANGFTRREALARRDDGPHVLWSLAVDQNVSAG